MRILACAIILLPVFLLAAGELPPEPKTLTERKARSEILSCVTGTFDMSQNARPWSSYLIVEQQDNKFPGFWIGGNKEGTTTFQCKTNSLDYRSTLHQSGPFSIELRYAPKKNDTRVAGGAWLIQNQKENEIRKKNAKEEQRLLMQITFERFDELTFVGVTGGSSMGEALNAIDTGRLIKLTAVATGRVQINANGKSAPIKAPVNLTFTEKVVFFTMNTSFSLPGQQLGLEGKEGENLTATLYCASARAVKIDLPTPANAEEGSPGPSPGD